MSKGTVLITGASTGIGVEFVRIFVREGYDLILVARSRDKLQKLAEEAAQSGAQAHVIAKDLSKPESAHELFGEVQNLKLHVDILVNNAGVGCYGDFQKTDLRFELQMMQLNMMTLTALTKLFLPAMLQKKSGKILNVASTAAFQPGPLMSVYYATKAYVLSFSEAIADELSGTGVSVTTLCPGPTESEFQRQSQMGDKNLFFKFMMPADKVAEVGYYGMVKGKRIAIPGWLNWFLAFSVRFTPRCLVLKIIRKAQGGSH